MYNIKKCVRQMLNVLNYAAKKKKKNVLNYVLFFVYEKRKCAKATAKNYSHWVYSILFFFFFFPLGNIVWSTFFFFLNNI